MVSEQSSILYQNLMPMEIGWQRHTTSVRSDEKNLHLQESSDINLLMIKYKVPHKNLLTYFRMEIN